jgi:hypothetical protein
VKYRNAPKAGGLADFARKFGRSGAGSLIITKDTLERREDAVSVPYWCMNG